MPKLVPIKVKICREKVGDSHYPPFNDLPPEVRGMMDWSYFF